MVRKLSVSMKNPAWRKARKCALERDNYHCTECPKDDITELQVHHIRPRSQGGTHALSNLKTLCFDCHADIHPWMRMGQWGMRRKSFDIEKKEFEREEREL